jgi:hypothetical protein
MKSILMFLLASGLCLDAWSAYHVQPLSEVQAREYKLDTGFYKKATLVQGILIVTSEKVPDMVHRETAYLFDMLMRSIQPEIATRIRMKKVLCLLIAHDELTSQLPQFTTNKEGSELDFYNWRQRGFLTHIGSRPTVVFAEEDVMEYEGGMQLESILVHEFGHVVHGAGFDTALQERLTESFEAAKTKGIWNDGRAAQRFRRVKTKQPVSLLKALVAAFPGESKALLSKCLDEGDITVNGMRVNAEAKVTRDDKVLIVFGGPKPCYAAKNRAEYWAEIFQSWYDTNRTMDHDHNHIHTRRQLMEYDPLGASLCEAVMGQGPWRFSSPRARVGRAHLAHLDLTKMPRVTDPPHIEKAAYDYYDGYWSDYWERLYDKHGMKQPEQGL